MLALSCRRFPDSVVLIGFDANLGPESTDGTGQWHNLHHTGGRVKNALGGHHHGGMSETGFPSGRDPEI